MNIPVLIALLIAMPEAYAAPKRANEYQPRLRIARCDRRLTRDLDRPDLETVEIEFVKAVERDLHHLKLAPDTLTQAIRASIREPLRLRGTKDPRFVLFVEPLGHPVRVEFGWPGRGPAIRVTVIRAHGEDTNRMMISQFVAQARVRSHRLAFTISSHALEQALAAHIDPAAIDEALARPISPPVAATFDSDEIWQIGWAGATPISLKVSRENGVLHVHEVAHPNRAEKQRYLTRSGQVHDDPKQQDIPMSEGIFQGYVLRYSPGVQSMLNGRDITKPMIAEAARTARGLLETTEPDQGGERLHFIGDTGGLNLDVTIVRASGNILLIVNGAEVTPGIRRRFEDLYQQRLAQARRAGR